MSGKEDVRDALHKQQGGKCMYCGRKLPQDIFHIDHKTPRKRNGSDRLSNQQLLCGTCNGRKGGDLTDGEFRRRYKLEPARGAEPPAKAVPKSYFDNITKQGQARKAKQCRQQEREPVKGPRQAAKEENRRINEKAEAELPLDIDLGRPMTGAGEIRSDYNRAWPGLEPVYLGEASPHSPSEEPFDLAPKWTQVIGKWDGKRYYEVNLLTGKKRTLKKKPAAVDVVGEWVERVEGEFPPQDMYVQAGGDMIRIHGNGRFVDIEPAFGKPACPAPRRARETGGAPKTRRGLQG